MPVYTHPRPQVEVGGWVVDCIHFTECVFAKTEMQLAEGVTEKKTK